MNDPDPKHPNHPAAAAAAADPDAPVTREVLDRVMAGGCQWPGCDHTGHIKGPLYMHPACHVGAQLEVSYFDGALTVACGDCHERLVVIAVAREAPPAGRKGAAN